MSTFRSLLLSASVISLELQNFIDSQIERRQRDREQYMLELDLAVKEGRACLVPLESPGVSLLRDCMSFGEMSPWDDHQCVYSLDTSFGKFDVYRDSDSGLPFDLASVRGNTSKRSDPFQFAFAEHSGSPKGAKFT